MDDLDLLAIDDLTDEEALAYMDLFIPEEPEHVRWKRLDLGTFSDEDCLRLFRFTEPHPHELKTCLHIPENITTANGLKCSAIEGLCILLRRLAYPNRLNDLVPIFGLHPTHLSLVCNQVLDHIHQRFGHLLSDLNQPWLTEGELRKYAACTHAAGLPIANCWGFIDGTVLPICRPSRNQREVYNGHKRTHALKYQSVVIPNGLIANLFGPMEGRRHDAALLAESTLLNGIRFHSVINTPLCLYGDSAYPLSPYLMCPYKGAVLTQEQEAFNRGMSSGREAVEWIFGKIVQTFAFVDFKKKSEIILATSGKILYCFCTFGQLSYMLLWQPGVYLLWHGPTSHN